MHSVEQVKTYRLDGEIKMLSPLSHIGESHGIDSYLAEQVVIGPDGQPEEVFVYSGNAFRGVMRDCGVRYLLDRLGGLQVPVETFHLLFSGGSLGAKTFVDVEQARMYRRLLPLFSILGGGTGNQIIAGKLRVGQLYPITQECKRILPQKYQSRDLPNWRQWTVEQSFTRKDDSKDERLRKYLISTEENQQLQLEDGTIAKKAPKEKEQPQQMRYTVECLAAGSVLYQRTELIDVTELELGAWVSCLAKWSQSPYLGGKSNVGLGLSEASWSYIIPGEDEEWKPFASIRDGKCLLSSVSEQAKENYDGFLMSLYQAYLDNQQAEIKMLLAGEA
jgi:CRISPR type IV-associated protein Csf2